MVRRNVAIRWVQAISLSRLAAGIVFAALAFQLIPVEFIAALYLVAVARDLPDGSLARRFEAQTHFGKVADLVSDKSLTIVSLLYAAARGIDLLPLSLVATREVKMIGMRLVMIDGG